MKRRHPPACPDSSLPPASPQPEVDDIFAVSEEMIICAIRSFPISIQVLLAALSRFVSLVIHGRIPDFARHLFFGARLTALSKEDGGVRPIAVGLTLRRLVAKVAGYHVRDEMSDLLAPR